MPTYIYDGGSKIDVCEIGVWDDCDGARSVWIRETPIDYLMWHGLYEGDRADRHPDIPQFEGFPSEDTSSPLL